MSKVLITGGTGFIGSHVVRAFCDNEAEVSCLVRKGGSLSNIEGLPVELAYGDIEDLHSLRAALEGVVFVIHIAGCAKDWGSYESFYKANVEGTLNVLRACAESGIKDIVITASISVYGEENCQDIKSENSSHNSHYPYFADKCFPCAMNYYRDTKAEAKEKAVEYAGNNGLNLTVIEPAWVYGEREFNSGFYEYLKSVRDGVPFLPGSKKNKYHVIYAGDLAKAYVSVFRKRPQGVNCYITGNDKAEKMDEIYRLFCREAGFKKPLRLPKYMVYPFGFLLELLYTVFHAKTPPVLTRGRVNMFYDNIEYSTRKARESLGFACEYSLEAGIARTIKWYKEQNLL
ncbi:MAG: NAD-dependent epimerase [Clostridia bacterium BRH_c25]|nr:MAG: NAD-dependent epimerase [Clostridia bacterium BRH_c25]